MDMEGKPARQAERARYALYIKRRKREESQPTDTENSAVPKKQQKDGKKRTVKQPKDKPANYPGPDNWKDQPVSKGLLWSRRQATATEGQKIKVRRAESFPNALI